MAKPDYVRKKFSPMLAKTLHQMIAHTITKQFPRIGGKLLVDMLAEMLVNVFHSHSRSKDLLSHGQILWLAISIDDPPARGKHIADTQLIPVRLDLSTPDDIHARINRRSSDSRLCSKAIRLCQQAYEQGGVLSNCDLSELLGANESRIATILADHQRKSDQLIPRRATTHDVGTGLTHKRIICLKRYAQGKTSDVIAKETFHSIDAVDRYLAQFDRVRHCRVKGMSPEATAFTLNCSLSLVNEYLAIDQELENTNP